MILILFSLFFCLSGRFFSVQAQGVSEALLVFQNWGGNSAGDFNSDGRANGIDFGWTIRNWTEPSPTPGSSPTPGLSPTPSLTPIPTPTPGPGGGYTGPIEIEAKNLNSNYNNYKNYGPFIARGMALSDDNYDSAVSALGSVAPGVELRLAFGSIGTIERKVTGTEIQALKDLGVTAFLYNPEGGHTPSDEFGKRYNADSSNPIAQFATLTKSRGFKAIWAPLRNDADKTSDAALQVIYEAGVDGITLQEQKFIEGACVDERVSAINSLISRHESIAGRSLELGVQIMSSRCDSGDDYAASHCGLSSNHYRWEHCDQFVGQIKNIINKLEIWPSGDESAFIRELRE